MLKNTFMLVHALFWLGLLASCMPATTPTAVIARPTLTVPSEASQDDPYVEPEQRAWLRSMMAAHPNGLSVSIQPAYKNKYVDWHKTFFATPQEGFAGEIVLGNGLPETRSVALLCLLDHIQIPCVPDAPLGQIVSMPSGELLALPIALDVPAGGLHDFDVMAVRDPYDDSLDATGTSNRYTVLATMNQNNIAVNGSTSAPAAEPITPAVRGRLDRKSIMDVAPTLELTDAYGNYPQWIEAEGQVGQPLSFYLHFNADVHDEEGDIIAVTAFLNYQQTPLYYEGVSHLPLLVERRQGRWQAAPVSIQLPDEAGVYELFIVARTDAFSPLEFQQSEGDLFGAATSKRIKIIVNE